MKEVKRMWKSRFMKEVMKGSETLWKVIDKVTKEVIEGYERLWKVKKGYGQGDERGYERWWKRLWKVD